MNATTTISKEEFLNKIEKAKKALDDVPHYDRRYLIDDVLLDKLFDLAYNSIPIKWIKNYASHKASKDLIDCYWHFWEDDVLKMVADWEKENEID